MNHPELDPEWLAEMEDRADGEMERAYLHGYPGDDRVLARLEQLEHDRRVMAARVAAEAAVAEGVL